MMAASIASGSICSECGLQSTKTGRAPDAAMAPAVAINVFAIVITSSPAPMPNAFKLRNNASVPELTPTA